MVSIQTKNRRTHQQAHTEDYTATTELSSRTFRRASRGRHHQRLPSPYCAAPAVTSSAGSMPAHGPLPAVLSSSARTRSNARPGSLVISLSSARSLGKETAGPFVHLGLWPGASAPTASHFSQLLALAPRSARFCGAERFEARSLAASSRATALREGQEVKDMRGCGTACQFNPSAHGVPVSFEL